MSLQLLEDYTSDEAESIEDTHSFSEDDVPTANRPPVSYVPAYEQAALTADSSGLPSAFDAFSQVSGPPEFLNNSIEMHPADGEMNPRQGSVHHQRHDNNVKGAVIEAKPQLIGIHERVRSDVMTGQQTSLSPPSIPTSMDGPRVPTAANPSVEHAAKLLRMCSECGIPKTFSATRGMLCPVCRDRPPAAIGCEIKKKGSAIKEKEKLKRMKGQSSHATWKSETEMLLRQQFD